MRRQLTITVACLTCLVVLAGCGSSKSSTSSTDSVKTDSSTPDSSTASSSTAGPTTKPTVKIPATLPTELVITDLEEGTGPAAKAGDDVSVFYVGVRSVDGTEFDSNFDSQPFPVTLGAGGVIQGWDQGLVGVKAGGLRQLDIPADLAYGDRPQGDIIKAGDEYRLYYMGCPATVFDLFGNQRQGVPVQIGLATSPDGINFTKVQGSAEGGAVLAKGAPGEWDEWFNCFSRILPIDGGWRMYFTGVGPSGHGGVGYAESEDGIHWTKKGHTFGPSGDPNRFDAQGTGTPHAISFRGGYLLAYEALQVPGHRYRIGLARSDDGLNWTRLTGHGHAGALVDQGPSGTWDALAIGTPYLLAEPDGSLKIYYVGFSEQGVTGIGMATCDGDDLLTWTKFQPE